MAAGWAQGIEVWDPSSDHSFDEGHHKTFLPQTNPEERNLRYTKWKMAVERSLGWAVTKRSIPMTDERFQLLKSIPASVFMFTSFIMLVVSSELVKR